MSEPTFYLEKHGSGVKLKCYIRHEKLVGGGFGDLIVRLEWTLAGKPALIRHLGGNQIEHLRVADLNRFLVRNIRLERPDLAALGDLFRGIKIGGPGISQQQYGQRNDHDQLDDHDHREDHRRWNDPAYRPVQAALLVLRRLAHREYELARFADFGQALHACQNSPAQIRGYCRRLRDGDHSPRRGRPREHQPLPMHRPITDHRINQCFHKIELIEVSPTV